VLYKHIVCGAYRGVPRFGAWACVYVQSRPVPSAQWLHRGSTRSHFPYSLSIHAHVRAVEEKAHFELLPAAVIAAHAPALALPLRVLLLEVHARIRDPDLQLGVFLVDIREVRAGIVGHGRRAGHGLRLAFGHVQAVCGAAESRKCRAARSEAMAYVLSTGDAACVEGSAEGPVGTKTSKVNDANNRVM
jgi:hypothetical protein